MLNALVSAIFALVFLSGCFFSEPPLPLQNTHWVLIDLNEESVSKADNRPEPHLLFHINDKSLHGSDGCNQLHAEYLQNEKKFTFINIRSTRIYCKEGMKQAEVFLATLKKTDKMEIEGDHLILYHEEKEIARFEARAVF